MPWIKSCLCNQEKKKTPTISPPIHLLLKNEETGGITQTPSHAFRCKTFKKPRPCHLCHQPIINEGSCCRVCKYVCHKVCESKEAAQRYTDTSWRLFRQSQIKRCNNDDAPETPTSQPNVEEPHKTSTYDISPSLSDDNPEKPEDSKETNDERDNMKDENDNEKHLENKDKGDEAENRRIVEIETIEVLYEPVDRKVESTIEVELHTHDEPYKNGSGDNKMLRSTSYNDYYGEVQTNQPRFAKSASNMQGSMDLSYVTERIISMWFPDTATSHAFRQGQRQAAHMLRNKHGDNYMVFNLSEPKRGLRSEHKYVKEVGWTPNLAPPLERLCSVCKEIDSWLSKDVHRIAVLHSRGSKEKLGVIVAAYMHYSSICGTAEQALDRFSMRKFLDDNIGPLRLPSNRRYVEYFAGLLSHSIKINAAPLYLTHVTVLGSPSFQNGGCKAFLKLYEGHTPVYTSGVYSVSNNVSQFTVNLAGERKGGLQLRGDILIRCYHRGMENDRETIFACQFHTCAVADHTLSFTKQELDFAAKDPRFPIDGAVELHFSSSPETRHPAPAPTPAVPYTSANDDPVVRADSPLVADVYDENDSDSDDVNHTFGPLDGSIYATIAKKPESSPGAVSSPLTVSMDSGISSAGHQQNANTNASGSPPPTAQPSPLTPEDQHRELDELLSDMMLTVQSIPDFKPSTSVTGSGNVNVSARNNDNGSRLQHQDFALDNVRYIDEEERHDPYRKTEYHREEDKEIPYHARENSKPFSYGVNQDMIGESKGLSSPSLVRKASVNKSHGDTLAKVQTGVYPSQKPTPNFQNGTASPYISNYSTLGKYSYSPTPRRKTPSHEKESIDDIFTQSALNAKPVTRNHREEYYKDDGKRYDPLKRSYTDGTIRRSPEKVTFKTNTTVTSPYSDSESLSPPGQFRNNTKSPEFHESYTNSNNLTWLQRQQQKLKERKEMRLREERQPHETRLFSELRQVQTRHMRPTASHRLDGYTSDTTAFADDDDDYTIPLHINTMHRNGVTPSSSQYSTLKSNCSTMPKNERPFMSVKRAHEKYNQTMDPASALAANPHGQIVRSSSRNVSEDHVDNSGLLSLVERKYNVRQKYASPENTFEQSTYTWRSQSTNNEGMDISPSHSSSPRPQTPAFPVLARTPYLNASTPSVQFDLSHERLPPKSPTTQRRLSFPSATLTKNAKWALSPERKDRPTSPSDLNGGMSDSEYRHVITQRSASATGYRENQNGSSSPTVYYGQSRRGSVASSANDQPPHEVSAAHVKIVRDTSKFWYKPTISREEAISMLRDKAPGTFVVRDSNSFPGAFGLALRVAQVPVNLQNKSSSGSDELIRHFLIEPTSKGVRLKGCPNEPVFSSLSALIYQHSITQIALPCRLILPERDLSPLAHPTSTQEHLQQIQLQGAACNVLYLCTLEMESLTGPQAVKKSVMQLFQRTPLPEAVVVHFKVNGQGITLTDNKRKLFFRKHYPINTISHCGVDPEEHRWLVSTEDVGSAKSSNRIFGFVARKPNVSNSDNQCHLFAELDPEQPATAIVNFVNKVLTSNGIKPNIV
ncbi:tensin-3 isoform X3 [Anthonomus grandis grandis]|uniref:tensin-3 isoform X3 n=1 Tax=Anthonomus grandis grandis TaxID=2921223 RepID=UPI002165D2B0|nr:tensin-3 isoform X3 [Anthonomus grandis grandis]